MKTAIQPRAAYIRPLTGLRFLAATLVFLHHIKFFIRTTDTPFQGWLTKYVFHEGFIGVGFFFMLSGFILAHRYERADLSRRGGGLREYVLARIARIYPLHLLTLAVMALVCESLNVPYYTRFWPSLLSNLTLTQAFIPDYRIYFAMNPVAWSLSDELFFYGLFPLVFGLPRHAFNLLLGVAIAAVAVLSLGWHSRLGAWFFYAFPPVRLADFLIGIGLYRLWAARGTAAKPAFSTGLLTELLAGAVFALALYYHPRIPAQVRYGCYYWPPLALLILSQAIGGGPLARLMSTSPFVYLGNISFAFYMVHVIMFTVYSQTLAKLYAIPWLTGSILMFGVVLLTAITAHHGVEVPANRWLRRRLGRGRPGKEAQPGV